MLATKPACHMARYRRTIHFPQGLQGTLHTECSTVHSLELYKVVTFSLSCLLLTSHLPDSMEIGQLFQGIGQLFKAHSSGVKKGGVWSLKKLSGWEETECKLELMLCKGDKRGSRGQNGVRGFGKYRNSLPYWPEPERRGTAPSPPAKMSQFRIVSENPNE